MSKDSNMKKFDISYKDEIISGKYKVVTCTNLEVEIVKWNHPGKYPIVGLVTLGLDYFPTALYFTEKGECNREENTRLYDLYLICDKIPSGKFTHGDSVRAIVLPKEEEKTTTESSEDTESWPLHRPWPFPEPDADDSYYDNNW